ncbi:hypothetical protein TNCV_1614071 [Trichonephila clavipes]|nr:hypothetical protein TNCV_1614071 [Trichonephila clavipes]
MGKEWKLPVPETGWTSLQQMARKKLEELEGREIFFRTPAPVVPAASVHKTFGPTDLPSTYTVGTRRIFGGIGHRTQAFRSGVRCSNH